jgi:hypothetical protein
MPEYAAAIGIHTWLLFPFIATQSLVPANPITAGGRTRPFAINGSVNGPLATWVPWVPMTQQSWWFEATILDKDMNNGQFIIRQASRKNGAIPS